MDFAGLFPNTFVFSIQGNRKGKGPCRWSKRKWGAGTSKTSVPILPPQPGCHPGKPVTQMPWVYKGDINWTSTFVTTWGAEEIQNSSSRNWKFWPLTEKCKICVM